MAAAAFVKVDDYQDKSALCDRRFCRISSGQSNMFMSLYVSIINLWNLWCKYQSLNQALKIKKTDKKEKDKRNKASVNCETCKNYY